MNETCFRSATTWMMLPVSSAPLGSRVHRADPVRGPARSEGHQLQSWRAEGVVCGGEEDGVSLRPSRVRIGRPRGQKVKWPVETAEPRSGGTKWDRQLPMCGLERTRMKSFTDYLTMNVPGKM